MRNRAFAIATALVLAMMAVAGLAHAQQTLLVANIPFEFVVGDQTLRAGEYRIEPAASSGQDFLKIVDADGRLLKIVWTMGVYARDLQTPPRLVFHCYGNQYFLSQIWPAASQLGRQLEVTPREKELASKETKHEVVLLARSFTR